MISLSTASKGSKAPKATAGASAASSRFGSFNGDIECQSVVCELNVVGQRRVGFLVRKIVTDVRQQCPTRLEAVDDFKRLRHRVVRRVRAVAQRIQDKDVKIVEERKRFLGNSIAIGQ